MEKTLRIDPKDPRPIWRQIEEGVQYLVASGSLAVGTGVPSVRDLARELQVNPATVSRAYQRLTDAGVLAVRRGDGTYVSDAPPLLTPAERADRLAQAARRYAGAAITLGAGRKAAADALAEAWEDLKAEPSEETR